MEIVTSLPVHVRTEDIRPTKTDASLTKIVQMLKKGPLKLQFTFTMPEIVEVRVYKLSQCHPYESEGKQRQAGYRRRPNTTVDISKQYDSITIPNLEKGRFKVVVVVKVDGLPFGQTLQQVVINTQSLLKEASASLARIDTTRLTPVTERELLRKMLTLNSALARSQEILIECVKDNQHSLSAEKVDALLETAKTDVEAAAVLLHNAPELAMRSGNQPAELDINECYWWSILEICSKHPKLISNLRLRQIFEHNTVGLDQFIVKLFFNVPSTFKADVLQLIHPVLNQKYRNSLVGALRKADYLGLNELINYIVGNCAPALVRTIVDKDRLRDCFNFDQDEGVYCPVSGKPYSRK